VLGILQWFTLMSKAMIYGGKCDDKEGDIN
jgi:hypothetical protein